MIGSVCSFTGASMRWQRAMKWVKQREQITDADYQPYFDHFDPDLYDPDRMG